MKGIIKITFVLFQMMITMNVYAGNPRHYLKTGTGAYIINNMGGPVVVTEYGYGLNQNLFIGPRLILSIAEFEGNNNTFYDYTEFGLALHYKFSSIKRLTLGMGGNVQFMRKYYISEYYVHDNLEHSLRGLMNLLYALSGSVDFTIIQNDHIDFGINGIVQVGEYNSYTVDIYMKFKH